MRLSQLTLLLAITAVHAVPSSVKHVLHEKRQTPSVDWVQGARVDPNAILPVRIGLNQNNLEKGYDFLMEV
jgi:tripeptidyl-peptidase-1